MCFDSCLALMPLWQIHVHLELELDASVDPTPSNPIDNIGEES